IMIMAYFERLFSKPTKKNLSLSINLIKNLWHYDRVARAKEKTQLALNLLKTRHISSLKATETKVKLAKTRLKEAKTRVAKLALMIYPPPVQEPESPAKSPKNTEVKKRITVQLHY